MSREINQQAVSDSKERVAKAMEFLDSDALDSYKSQRIENKVEKILDSADEGIKKFQDPQLALNVLARMR